MQQPLTARQETLLQAFEAGTFLEAVFKATLADRDERDDLAIEIAALHNEGRIDVVAAFEGLKGKSGKGTDFFLTRHVFEKVLPQVANPILPVMRCVLTLYRDAGQDMAAGTIFESFIGYCLKDELRPRDALQAIVNAPNEFADLLTAALVAGSTIDCPRYLAETSALAANPDIELRRRAIFSVGRLKWPEGSAVPDSAYAILEVACQTETDDNIMGSIVKSAFALWQKDTSSRPRAEAIVSAAITKGGEVALHSASAVFGFYTNELSPALLEALLASLLNVNPANKGTIDNIDYGINHLIKSQELRGIEFLEKLLLNNPDSLSLTALDSVMHSISEKPSLFGRLATRWFLKGKPVLCEGLFQVACKMHGEKVVLAIDPAELEPKDYVHILFVARKAIGYLLSTPLLAASIVVSLMRQTNDAPTLEALKSLLVDPILLNYPGISDTYLVGELQKGEGPAELMISDAKKMLELYFEDLHSIGSIPELHPSGEQRETQMRHFGRQVSASFKEAEKKSVFFGIVSKSVLLYGRKSIFRVHRPHGQSQRMETALQTHSTTIEYPRLDSIDPVGLDYMLRLFRVERFKV